MTCVSSSKWHDTVAVHPLPLAPARKENFSVTYNVLSRHDQTKTERTIVFLGLDQKDLLHRKLKLTSASSISIPVYHSTEQYMYSASVR